jgi:uncharacterized protein DUF5990
LLLDRTVPHAAGVAAQDNDVIIEPMVREVPLRIAVVRPPPGVGWAVQSGRKDLIEPSERSDAMIAFDLSVRLGAPRPDGRPSLLGSVTRALPAIVSCM